MEDLRLLHMPLISQLFYIIANGILVLLVAKIVDDLLVTGLHGYNRNFQHRFYPLFCFGTALGGPGILQLYRMTI